MLFLTEGLFGRSFDEKSLFCYSSEMKWLFFFAVFFPIISLTESDESDFHICFFELDNRTSSKNLITRLVGRETAERIDLDNTDVTGSLGQGVSVHTYTPRSSHSGIEGFKAMIERTQQGDRQCDSLVISGHHTGNWYGQHGSLKLKEIEDLSCYPKYKDWFKNIKALWLDGCNTVTDNLVAQNSPPTPDSESARVSEKETPSGDSIEGETIRDLSQAYSLSLDQNTPLSSRYLRAFPNTQIYGFNGAAPLGETENNQRGNQSFIVNHLSYLGQALKAEERLLEQNENVENLELGLIALTSDPCAENRIEAWEQIGQSSGVRPESIENQSYEMAEKLGCDLILAKQVLDDPTSREAREALARKIKDGDYPELLELANEILENHPQAQDKAIELAKTLILETLDTINEEDAKLTDDDDKISLSHLLFNNIYETWETAKEYQNRDSDFFDGVKTRLSSDTFKKSFEVRIESNQTSSLRKADYIKFYTDVNDINPPFEGSFVESAVSDLVEKSSSLFPGLRSPRDRNLSTRSKRALALSVIDQLFQYDLLSVEQKGELLESRSLFGSDDSFTLYTKARLTISLDEENSLAEITNQPVTPYREQAIRVFTERHFQNEDQDQAVQGFQTFMNDTVGDNTDKKTIAWETMHFQLQFLSREERINLMQAFINSDNEGAETTRAFVSDYAQRLPEAQKSELCEQIKPKYIWYKNRIGCSQ